MSNKTESKREKGSPIISIIIGILIGGSIGTAIGLVGTMTTLVNSSGGIIAFIILGASVGAVVGIVIGLSTWDKAVVDKSDDNNKGLLRKTVKDISENARLQLREEQLEISKELVQSADVISHKEIVTEEKVITVPVTREVLVIEKRSLDNNTSENDREYSEIMRIPLTEEQIEVVKNQVKLEDVSIYKNQYQEIEHIEEILKKETVHIQTPDNVSVVDKDIEEDL